MNEDLAYVCVRPDVYLPPLAHLPLGYDLAHSVPLLHEGNECSVVDIVAVILRCICYFNGYYTNNDLHNYMLWGCQRGWAGFVA